MPVLEERVQLTFSIPKSVADRITEFADRSDRTVEAEVKSIVLAEVSRRDHLKELLQIARDDYDAHLIQTGQSRPTDEEIMEQLKQSREEIANAVYPD